MRYPLTAKLTAAFAAIALVTSLSGFYLMYMLRTVSAEYQSVAVKLSAANSATLDLEAAIAQQISAARGYVLFKNAVHRDEMAAAIKRLDIAAGVLTSLVQSEAERAAIVGIQASSAEYARVADDAIAQADMGSAEAAKYTLSAVGLPIVIKMTPAVAALRTTFSQRADEAAVAAARQAASAQTMGLIAVMATLALSLLSGAVLARGISRPVRLTAAAALRLSAGDLTVDEIKVTSRDEVGDMARAFNQMISNLRQLVAGVNAGTHSVTSASAELTGASAQAAHAAQGVAQAVSQMATGAAEQARSAEQVNQTMCQFGATIQEIATGAGSSATEVERAAGLLRQMVRAMNAVAADSSMVAREAQQAAQTARSGADVVLRTAKGMDRIRTVVGASASRMQDLERLSTQIGAISSAIGEIAAQTNLLALNAAIESARAGEHGRGFAVVADEVRKLSERSAKSAGEITHLVNGIQSATSEAARAMAEGTAEVEAGSRLAAEAGSSLQAILQTAEKAASAVQAIAQAANTVQTDAQGVVSAFDAMAALTEENTASTEEMAAGAMQVTDSVGRIAGVAQENAAVSQEVSASVTELTASSLQVATAAGDLRNIAADLQGQVARFKVLVRIAP